ncbi:transposase [Mycoplasmatota bacterium]|nr:transposase [Mycoplasmatota bacterium]
MPRKARIKDDYGIFYIYQHSSSHRNLFECDHDREQFLTILARTQKKFQFKLYAYCLLSHDEYHLIIDVNGGDLSKIMKSINITYAMYAKCKGKLFNDRYKSKLLKSNTEIVDIINTIHNKNQTPSSWNNYCAFNGLTPINIDLFYPSNNQLTSIQSGCTNCIHSVSEAKEKLNDIACKENKVLSELLNDHKLRNQLIRDFRKHSTLSLKDLGKVFGDLSESSICKIINS